MQENEEIYFVLDYIDYQSIRPLRAILANQATQEDYDKLKELETEAEKLRGELDE